MGFAELGLGDDVLRAVADAGYSDPTPIQEKAVPYVLMGRDVLGCAQTGTGKTAGFTLPMIDILAQGRAKARMPRSLILEPTRELAAQVAESFDKYGKHHRLNKVLLIGGESMNEQIKTMERGVDVLIATPGRLLDLFERGGLILRDVKILVIDEADRMLDMGFIPDVERIVSLLPPLRQTLFFSATMPPEIRRLADAFLSNPKEISVAPPSSAAETVIQKLVVVPHGGGAARGTASGHKEKRAALRGILRHENVRNAFIFCNRKRDVGITCRSLERHGFNAGQLHGDMTQTARTETLDKFRRGDIPLLVCSDVAARGIDISDVSHVFNFDVPTHAEDYVHRIGRTGRAGKEGHAFTLAVPEEGKYVDAIQKLLDRQIERISVEGLTDGELEAAPSSKGRGGRGRRPKAEKPTVPPAGRSRERKPREEADKPVTGLGDHVPAFLLRPVKLSG